jgi:hypothetical protein
VSVSVVIPWRSGCPHRERSLEWVLGWYRTNHPDFEVTIGVTDGPWCKAAAVAAGLTTASGDVVVIADADVYPADPDALTTAVGMLDRFGWAIPHTFVHRLTEDGTTALIAGDDPGKARAQRPYRGWPGGGLTVLRRETYEQVPIDPRFIGWGQEDMSWAFALAALVGRPWRGSSDLFHLWHPPQERKNRIVGSDEGFQLYRRYESAKRSPDRMRALIEEAR